MRFKQCAFKNTNTTEGFSIGPRQTVQFLNTYSGGFNSAYSTYMLTAQNTNASKKENKNLDPWKITTTKNRFRLKAGEFVPSDI